MASRSGGGMGVTVALVISILLVLTLVLVCMLMYTKKDQAEARLASIENDLRAYIRPQERERDEFKRLSNEAGNKSVVAFLNDSLKKTMQLSTGNPEMKPEGLESVMAGDQNLQGSSILTAYRNISSQATSEADRANSLQDQLDISSQRQAQFTADMERARANHDATVDELTQEVGRMQARVDDYVQRVETAERDMDGRVANIRADYDKQVYDLNADVEERDNMVASLNDAVNSLQNRLAQVRPQMHEDTIADGKVVDVMDNGSVFISLGEQDHVVLGMRFEVYGDVSDTRADANGLVPSGKATVEVTRLDATTSTARIIRNPRGRAVTSGDILVNPLFDRNKSYTFFVFGDFDLDRVGGATEFETETVKSRIREWGGNIVDEFRADIDFLVIGVQPREPGPLPPSPDGPTVQRYVAARNYFRTYQDNVAQATNMSVPVLNQNRLFTLIGYYGP